MLSRMLTLAFIVMFLAYVIPASIPQVSGSYAHAEGKDPIDKKAVKKKKTKKKVKKRETFAEKAKRKKLDRERIKKLTKLDKEIAKELKAVEKAEKENKRAKEQKKFWKDRHRELKRKKDFSSNAEVNKHQRDLEQARKNIKNYEYREKGSKKRISDHTKASQKLEREARKLL